MRKTNEIRELFKRFTGKKVRVYAGKRALLETTQYSDQMAEIYASATEEKCSEDELALIVGENPLYYQLHGVIDTRTGRYYAVAIDGRKNIDIDQSELMFLTDFILIDPMELFNTDLSKICERFKKEVEKAKKIAAQENLIPLFVTSNWNMDMYAAYDLLNNERLIIKGFRFTKKNFAVIDPSLPDAEGRFEGSSIYKVYFPGDSFRALMGLRLSAKTYTP